MTTKRTRAIWWVNERAAWTQVKERFMKRCLVMFVVLAATAALSAQSPKGWLVRADRSTSPLDPDAAGAIKFMAMGSGFHAINPQAAVYWNPANTVSGNYSLKGTFTLLRPSSHVNYYGLVFGGSSLEGPQQNYIYFVVAQDGTWLVKRRDGDTSTRDVAGRTSNDAVKRLRADGKATNALEGRRAARKNDVHGHRNSSATK